MVKSTQLIHCNTVIIIIRADKYKRMKVYANCETIDDVKQAVQMGAEGIGLCRTEHMFFKENRIDLMVSQNSIYLSTILILIRQQKARLILSVSTEERDSCLLKMLECQRLDFLAIFRLMSGRSVTIRLLDPPLSEFLPVTITITITITINHYQSLTLTLECKKP